MIGPGISTGAHAQVTKGRKTIPKALKVVGEVSAIDRTANTFTLKKDNGTMLTKRPPHRIDFIHRAPPALSNVEGLVASSAASGMGEPALLYPPIDHGNEKKRQA